eukprot:45836_1
MTAQALAVLISSVLYVIPMHGSLFVDRDPTITNTSGDYYIASLHDFGTDTDYFNYDTLTCSNGPICFIDCDAASACYSGTLNATDNVEHIYLNCPNDNSCSYLDIYSSDTLKTIDMHCPSYFSCSHINIHSSPSDLFTMDCTQDRACAGVDLNLTYTTSINITCSYVTTSTATTYSPCSQAQFHMEYASNVDIFCAKASCYFTDFFLNYTNTANIVANGRYAVKYAEIYGQYMPSDGGGLTVECQDAYPCPETKVYCPVGETSSCTIDCPDPSSCYNLYAFINNGMYSGLTLNCNNAYADACTSMDIMCNNTIPPGSSATQAQYRTVMTYNVERVSEWFCGTWDIYGPYSCCPFTTDPIIDCASNGYTDSNGDCSIDCASIDCALRVIDGSNANSLSIDCNKVGGDGCKGSKVQCPSADGSSCDLICDEPNACKSIVIQVSAAAMSSVHMHCASNYSCSETSIVFDTSSNNDMPLTSVAEIDLTCIGYKSCKDNVFYFKPYEIEMIETFRMNCIGEESCTYNEIDLWLEYGINTLNITCDGRYSCGDEPSSTYSYGNLKITNQFETNIHNQFTLECNGYGSCYQSIINVLSPGITTVACNGPSACSSTSTYSYYFMISDISNQSTVDISCDSQLSVAAVNTTGSCMKRRFTLRYAEAARNTQNVNIICNTWDCFHSVFELDWAKEVTMDCEASYACKKATVTAPNVKQLSIACDGNDHSCVDAMIECPASNANGCSVSCDGSNVCDNMQISVNDGFTYNSFLDINCGIGSGSCDDITFECLTLDYAMTPKSTVSYVWNDIGNTYECSSSTLTDCCPWYDNTQVQEITCAVGVACAVDCSATADGDCRMAVIDASGASQLVLNCNAANDCSNSTVLCPVAGCQINCNAETSCNGLRINYFGHYMRGDIGTIELSCSYAGACSYTYINAPHVDAISVTCTASCEYVFVSSQFARNIDISCVGSDESNDLFAGCNYHYVYAQYAQEFSLDCAARHGCYSNRYYVDEVGVVSVKARGQYAIRSINLYAFDAGSVQIYCAGKERYVCDGYWRYNELVTSIHCYGYGCGDSMGTHVIHEDISVLDLSWNGCDTCDSLQSGYMTSYCFGTSSNAKWTIDCGLTTDGEWTGTSCSPIQCECLGLSDRIKTDFITDITDPLCEVSATNAWPSPTPEPTKNPSAPPTTAIPTASPTTAIPTVSPIPIPTVSPQTVVVTAEESVDNAGIATSCFYVLSVLCVVVTTCIVL